MLLAIRDDGSRTAGAGCESLDHVVADALGEMGVAEDLCAPFGIEVDPCGRGRKYKRCCGAVH